MWEMTLHLDGLLKGLNPPKYMIEAVVRLLKFGPQSPRGASQGKREEDNRKDIDILIITTYPHQESRYGASGQQVSVGTSCHGDVCLLAYPTVTIFIGPGRTTGADLCRDEMAEIK